MKIMVIDDEPIVSRGLRALVRWEDHGFEWLPPAENGEEALELMQHNLPDMILLDCKMPHMNGIELLTEVNRRKWPVKSIFLSGHNEFQYAQQAIQLGASDYLLKPPNMDELLNVVLRVKKEREDEQRLGQQLKENLPLIRDRFLRGLLEGARMNKAIFEEKTSYLKLPIVQAPFVLGIIQVEEDPEHAKLYSYEDQQLINFAILNIAEETLNRWEKKCLFHESGLRFVFIGNIQREEEAALLRGDFTQLIENLRLTLKYHATIGLSPLNEDMLHDGKRAFNQAKTALEYRYYTGPNEVIALEDLEWERDADAHSSKPKEAAAPFEDERLFMALKVGNVSELIQWINNFLIYLKETDFPVQTTKTLSLQSMISASLVLTGLHPKLQMDQLLTTEDIQAIMTVTSLDELGLLLRFFLEKLIHTTIELRKTGKNIVVEHAKQYIEGHFHENITLDSIAKTVYVSPVYLSFLFKQVEAINLTEYLTEVRLEAAKKLLTSSSLRTYEIANQVGYQDEKYFSRIFKKKLGLSPTEYRNQGGQ
ncbi:response regulator [Paenibacillus sp. LMG 31456]|uniref:Response regulator n=1 Tax=Paenibacillus foliorum TaxID=2654974 RepID=A0A972JWR9_9BACL|nr:response regulator [Paenibacillus foliorum]NOU91704.1 response regulator [Paenibacillus foliorum]